MNEAAEVPKKKTPQPGTVARREYNREAKQRSRAGLSHTKLERQSEWEATMDGVRQRYEARRPAVPPPPDVGWWIGKSTKELLARLSETNPALVDSLFKNRRPTLEPEEVNNAT